MNSGKVCGAHETKPSERESKRITKGHCEAYFIKYIFSNTEEGFG